MKSLFCKWSAAACWFPLAAARLFNACIVSASGIASGIVFSAATTASVATSS